MELSFSPRHIERRSSTPRDRVAAESNSDLVGPLYLKLRDTLRERILTGAYRAHDRLPSEPELVRQFHVSRVTVRQALRALRDEGLVRSAQGKGSFVSLRRGVQDSRSSLGFHELMATLGFSASSRVLAATERRASAEVARALGLKRGATVLELKRLRCVNDEPVSLEARYFPVDIGRSLLTCDLTLDIHPLLEKRCSVPLSRAEVRIEASGCAKEHAKTLQLDVGKAVLQICRLTYSAHDRPVDFQRHEVVIDHPDHGAHFAGADEEHLREGLALNSVIPEDAAAQLRAASTE